MDFGEGFEFDKPGRQGGDGGIAFGGGPGCGGFGGFLLPIGFFQGGDFGLEVLQLGRRDAALRQFVGMGRQDAVARQSVSGVELARQIARFATRQARAVRASVFLRKAERARPHSLE